MSMIWFCGYDQTFKWFSKLTYYKGLMTEVNINQIVKLFTDP
jgi:hypothetical protein